MKRHWRVLLRGENFLVHLKDTPTRIGFYATRFATANDEEAAEALAVTMIKSDPELIQAVINEPSDPPMIYLEDLEEIANFDTEGSGYTFFMAEDEDADTASDDPDDTESEISSLFATETDADAGAD